MKRPLWLVRAWQRWMAVGWELTYFHSDDVGESSWDVDLPDWPWRATCWIFGHEDNTYGECVFCRRGLR